jgi:hypothetical protein
MKSYGFCLVEEIRRGRGDIVCKEEILPFIHRDGGGHRENPGGDFELVITYRPEFFSCPSVEAMDSPPGREETSSIAMETIYRLKGSPTDRYAVGSVLTLTGRKGANEGEPIDVIIRDQIHVSMDRTNQIVKAAITSGVLRGNEFKESPAGGEGMLIAKIYDPEFAPVDENCKGGPRELCARSKEREKHAYEKLARFQGSNLAILYGEYDYEPGMKGKGGGEGVSVLLFEMVKDPELSKYLDVEFTAKELELLKTNAFKLLDNVHGCGVYHGDIAARNLLCRQSDLKLTLLDFEEAGFDDVDYWPHLEDEELLKRKKVLIRRLQNNDTAGMWRTLRDFGVKDGRPEPVMIAKVLGTGGLITMTEL